MAMTMAVVKVATALIIIIREWGDWKYSGAHSDTKGCADEANQTILPPLTTSSSDTTAYPGKI